MDVNREENNDYVIQVYQIVQNPEETYIATDVWFHVDKNTGVINKLL